MKKIHVNICDYIKAFDSREKRAEAFSDPEARNNIRNTPVIADLKLFDSEGELAAYSRRERRIYPRNESRKTQNRHLRLLMAHILPGGLKRGAARAS